MIVGLVDFALEDVFGVEEGLDQVDDEVDDLLHQNNNSGRFSIVLRRGPDQADHVEHGRQLGLELGQLSLLDLVEKRTQGFQMHRHFTSFDQMLSNVVEHCLQTVFGNLKS